MHSRHWPPTGNTTMNTAAQSAYDALVMALAEAQAEVNADLEQLPIIPEQHGMNVLDSFSSDDNEEDFGEDAGADDGAAANAVGVHAGANDALVVGEEQELTTNCERVLHLRRLMDRGGDSLRMSLQQLASLCQMRDNARQRDFKDELRRQGVIERMVQTIEEAEGDAQRGNYNSTRDLRYELYNALARSLFDHRQNTVLVTELGLLKTTGEALCRCEQREDEDLSETQLCCVNNACGMILSGKHQLVLSSGIIPVLVRYAGGEANTTRTGRQIATAALANLSNTPDLCQALIQAGAVEVTPCRHAASGAAHPHAHFLLSSPLLLQSHPFCFSVPTRQVHTHTQYTHSSVRECNWCAKTTPAWRPLLATMRMSVLGDAGTSARAARGAGG